MKGTIKSNGDIERLFQTGRRSSSYLATVLACGRDAAGARGRCAYIAGKKLGSAPLRNRCKRVLREAVRELGGPWEGHDVAFIARRKVASARHGEVVKALERQLADLGIR